MTDAVITEDAIRTEERERCARLVLVLGGHHRDFLATCIRNGTVPDKIEARVARLAAEKIREADAEDLM